MSTIVAIIFLIAAVMLFPRLLAGMAALLVWCVALAMVAIVAVPIAAAMVGIAAI